MGNFINPLITFIRRMIESVWKTPVTDPVTIITGEPINVQPGETGSQTHVITLDKDAPPTNIKLQVSLPGPGLIPEVNIHPHLHFASGSPYATLDGEPFDIRQGTVELEPGVPRTYIVFIGLNDKAPWDGMFIVQVYRNIVLENR